MPQTIKCRFERYVAPKKDENWFVRKVVLACEQFRFSFPVEEKTFEITTEHPELFLQPDRPFTVSKSLIDNDADGVFRPVRTDIRYAGGETVEIDMLVEEVRPSPFGRWFATLEEEQKGAVGGVLFLWPAFLVGLAVYPFVYYPEPMWLWAWVGRHFIDIVRFGLPVFAVTAGVSRVVRIQSQPLQSAALAAIVIIPIIVMADPRLLTSLFGTPPTSGGPDAYIKYLNSMKPAFDARFAVIVSLAPWFAILLKWFGLDLLGSIVRQTFAKGESAGE